MECAQELFFFARGRWGMCGIRVRGFLAVLATISILTFPGAAVSDPTYRGYYEDEVSIESAAPDDAVFEGEDGAASHRHDKIRRNTQSVNDMGDDVTCDDLPDRENWEQTVYIVLNDVDDVMDEPREFQAFNKLFKDNFNDQFQNDHCISVRSTEIEFQFLDEFPFEDIILPDSRQLEDSNYDGDTDYPEEAFRDLQKKNKTRKRNITKTKVKGQAKCNTCEEEPVFSDLVFIRRRQLSEAEAQRGISLHTASVRVDPTNGMDFLTTLSEDLRNTDFDAFTCLTTVEIRTANPRCPTPESE